MLEGEKLAKKRLADRTKGLLQFVSAIRGQSSTLEKYIINLYIFCSNVNFVFDLNRSPNIFAFQKIFSRNYNVMLKTFKKL